MNFRIGLVAVATAMLLATSPAAARDMTPTEKANLKVVLDLTAAMQARDVGRASSYLADGYIQHNPFVPTGKSGFVGFFTTRWKDAKPAEPETPVVTVTQGDLVSLVFRRPKPEPADPSRTYDSFWFDTYRVQDGKVAEHWDASIKPPVPPRPAN